MAVISELTYLGRNITKYNNTIISNITLDDVNYHFAKNTEVTDGKCSHAVEEPLIDMQIYGSEKGVGDYDTDTGKYKIPIKLEGGRNLFDPRQWNKITHEGWINFQYLEDEDCFVLNGEAIKEEATYVNRLLPVAIPVISGAKYSLRATYVSGTITKPVNGIAVAFFGGGNTPTEYKNWYNVALSNKTTSLSAACSYQYINRFWFYLTKGIKFNNYKVKIQLEIGGISHEHESYVKTFNLFLNESLKTGEYFDYKNKKVFKSTGEEKETVADVPEIIFAKGTTTLSVDTENQPSEFRLKYWKQIGAESESIPAQEKENIQIDSHVLIQNTGATIRQKGSRLFIGE